MPLIARTRDVVRWVATLLLPQGIREQLRAVQRRFRLQSVPVGSVDFGSLDRLSPISPIFGKDRALLSVERYYIECFLEKYSADVRGRTLEMGDPAYTVKFGGDRVTQEAGDPQRSAHGGERPHFLVGQQQDDAAAFR